MLLSTEHILVHRKLMSSRTMMRKVSGPWLGLRLDVFTCVSWQVTLCDLVWKWRLVALRWSSIKSYNVLKLSFIKLLFLSYITSVRPVPYFIHVPGSRNLKGPDIYIPPLTGKPEQQQFTIQSGVLTSTSSRWCSASSGAARCPNEWTLDRQSAARQTDLCLSVTIHWSKGSLVQISEWPYCVYILKVVQCFLIPKVNHHFRVRVTVRTCHRWVSPRRMACLQRLAGTDPVSLRSWSVQRTRGRPGRRLQSLPRERPDARPTWQCRALCAGVPWVSRAMWPNTDKWHLLMKSITGGKPVRADISAFVTCWDQCMCKIWHSSCGMPPTFFHHTKVVSRFLPHIVKWTTQGPGTGES